MTRPRLSIGPDQQVASSSVQLAEHAGSLLDQIEPAIRRTAELVQEIASAAREQSTGLAQISISAARLSRSTQTNAVAAEELSATAE